MRPSIYMLAVMPPTPLTQEIEQVRFEFAGKYNCKAALKPPVHITLIPPYKTTPDSEGKIIPVLEAWAKSRQPFTITLHNYQAFRKNGVVYIDVEDNEAFRLFQSGLRKTFLEVLPVPEVERFTSFHPHITVGYRDIPREVFPSAADEYVSKEFSASFVADKFYLWKHNGKIWEVLRGFSLPGTVQ